VLRTEPVLTQPSLEFNPALHRFLIFLAAMTFLLLLAGGLVTSNQAGLSVPDWPTSFGSWYRIPPMVGGVRYEHSHRMIAEVVGLLTIVAAIWIWRQERRGWMRWLGWIALAGVIVQGVLGGLTVRMLLPWYVSSAHAVVAQSFLCLIVLMAVFTSRQWVHPVAQVAESGRPSLYWLCLISIAVLYLQLFFGAAFRHRNQHGGLSIEYHIVNSIFVTGVLVFTSVHGMMQRDIPAIRKPAFLVHMLLWLQIALGIASYMTRVAWGADAAQPLPSMVAATVAHLGVGALLLAATFVLAAQAKRNLPRPEKSPAMARDEVAA
jgi:cytochrome c oxidase assembly protein subunit 15